MRGPITCSSLGSLVTLSLLGAGLAAAQVASRSVNMVAGTDWPGGDPFLQRQNEPTVAVSTRNPMHLLAGANDYRTVDLPGTPDDKMTGDAWLGTFTSTDGGATWKSTLLPGYPQEAGSGSPLHGFDAGADPVVRAGPHGLFYYSGIVFDRTNPVLEARRRAQGLPARAGAEGPTSAVFVARYIDNNNKENGDPIAYLGATLAARNDDPNVFLDKPWLAVDMPRRGAGTCTVTQSQDGQTVTQTLPVGNVYLAYSQFTGSQQAGTSLGKLMFTRSTDCGVTWSTPLLVSGTHHINQGATIALDPRTGVVFVVWRRFGWPQGSAAPSESDAILIARSLDRGQTFSAPETVAELNPFDQSTGYSQFRTNSYPTAGVDRFGRVLVAYSSRGVQQPDGDARILLTWARYPSRLRALFTLDEDDGTETMRAGERRPGWTTPAVVDRDVTRRGHQIMPSMLVTGLRVQIAWVDLQEDHTWGVYTREEATGRWLEERVASNERQATPAQVFTPRISDVDPQTRRHSADVWVAQADPGDRLTFSVGRASDYRAGTRVDAPGVIQQLQFNPPNLPLFKQGGAAFWGDYIDLGGQPLEQKQPRRWRHTLQPPAAHVVFTDNRDVRAPLDGNWALYTPPMSLALKPVSTFDPTQTTCNCDPAHPERAGMRNQNVYAARVTQGLHVSAPGNAKPLGRIQRAFVVVAANDTFVAKTFRMSIASQPSGGSASFRQFAALTQLDLTIGPRSSASRTVYMRSTDSRASVKVDVRETTNGVIVPALLGGLQGSAILNPDLINPDLMNPDLMNPDMASADVMNAEVYAPDLMNPDLMNPDLMNPDLMNPDLMNPDLMNPDLMNPDLMNPDLMNPGDVNVSLLNPDLMNPDLMNPDLMNGAFSDTVWTLTNNGNTTAGYDVRLLLRSAVPQGFSTQLLLYKTYLTPVARACKLTLETQNVLLANVPSPRFDAPGDPLVSDPADGSLKHATLWLAPGESAKVTLRVYDPNKYDDVRFDAATAVTPAAVPQAVDTVSAASGVTQPVPVLPSAPLISFEQGPSNTPVGKVITPPVVVWLRDHGSAGMAGVTIALSILSGPTGATLDGATAVTDVDGRATFEALSLDKNGTYRLQAGAAGVFVNSAAFDVVALTLEFTQVSAGSMHTCALKNDGTVACWGDNMLGQSTPPPSLFTQVSASSGGWHTCGVKTDGTVVCWGDNRYGQLTTPSGTFTQVDAGAEHTCGVRSDGTLACWGWNEYGESTPPPGTFTQVGAGYYHTCGVRSDGTVACWGFNGNGQSTAPAGTFIEVSAGSGHSCGVRTDRTIACWGADVPQASPPSGTFTQMDTGSGHACGVRSVDGSLACWGNNDYGQSTPPSGAFTQVSTGAFHSCGVRSDGTVACWGYDVDGQSTPPAALATELSAGANHNCLLRDGTLTCWGNNDSGQSSPPAGTFTQMSAGGAHTCAVSRDGSAVCWGSDSYGQSTPPAGGFAQVSGGWEHNCGVRNDGSVACWGWDDDGQSSPPSVVFVRVDAGGIHTCGLKGDGSVVCWGDDQYGQSTPPNETSFTQVSAGGYHTCGVVKANGTVACWGWDNHGQSTPPPSGIFVQVSAGSWHTCALRNDGTLACWGRNDLGQSTPPSGTFNQVSAGAFHTCALKRDGTVVCWGDSSLGQTTAPTLGRVSAGYYHSCRLKSNGGVACWGDNSAGQSTHPPGTFTQVSAGLLHTCSVKSGGSVACWGDNSSGQSTPPPGTFTQVSASLSYVYTCGIRSDGRVACWGRNDYGQGTPPADTFSQVSAGFLHTCGLKNDGTVACWGDNGHGQSTPPAGTFTQVGVGGAHTCGLKSDGTVACWGSNAYGQTSPAPSGTFMQISTGAGHNCGVKSDGTVACWGWNDYGQSSPPAGTFTQVSAGGLHTCALKRDDSVVCWGDNGYGQSTPLVPVPLVITTYAVPDGSLVLDYDATLKATGGQPPFTWSVTSGSLPPGLGLTRGTGHLFGTPTSPGVYSFTISVFDSASPQQAATRDLTLTVYAYAITGALSWNEAPITAVTRQPARVWVGQGNQSFYSYRYDTRNGTYAIPVPEGTYAVVADIDAAAPFDEKHFPGDYYCYLSSVVVDGTTDTVTANPSCAVLIHLTSPADNSQEIGAFPPPYPAHASPVTFAWESIPMAASYGIQLYRVQDDPYGSGMIVLAEDGIALPQRSVTLASSGANDHYEAHIWAYNSNGVIVGRIMVEYDAGFGWDYRFKVP